MDNVRHSTDSLTEENFKPATSRQCWALKLATGIDYRDQNLSFEKAKSMIQEANEASGYKKPAKIPTILHFLASDESTQKLKNCICNEMELKSIITSVDFDGKPKENAKKYIFLGPGCGFSWIEYDKRNFKAKMVIEKANDLRKDIDLLIQNLLGAEIIQYLKDVGNPIQAIQAQNMEYKNQYNQLIVDYLVLYFNVESIFVNSRLD